MMLAIISIIISFVVGLFFGGYFFYLLMVKVFAKNPALVLKHLSEDTQVTDEDFEEYVNAKTNEIEQMSMSSFDECVELIVERHGDQFFLFLKENDVFVSQGKSIIEALDIAHSRYPGTDFKYYLTDEDVI